MRYPVRFAEQVPANTPNWGDHAPLTHAVKVVGRLKRAVLTFYPGAQLDLRLRLSVRGQNGDGPPRFFPILEGKGYLDGDDDTFAWSLDVPVSLADGDVIYVEAANQDATNAYDYALDLEIEYGVGVPGVR